MKSLIAGRQQKENKEVGGVHQLPGKHVLCVGSFGSFLLFNSYSPDKITKSYIAFAVDSEF